MRIFNYLIFVLYYLNITSCYNNVFSLNRWHCIDFLKNINIHKPYIFNIGHLSLKTIFNNISHPNTMLNIYNDENIIGYTTIYDDKLWWSFEPKFKKPHIIPFANNKNFETTILSKNINKNFKEILYDLFDLDNVKNINKHQSYYDYQYKNFSNGVILNYKYKIDNNLKILTRDFYNIQSLIFFEIFNFPYDINFIIYLNKNDILVININLLPLANNETKLLITLKHNFWKSFFDKKKLKSIFHYILQQDKKQQLKIVNHKSLILLQKPSRTEHHYLKINELFSETYEYALFKNIK